MSDRIRNVLYTMNIVHRSKLATWKLDCHFVVQTLRCAANQKGFEKHRFK
jgi:hypothetical protein